MISYRAPKPKKRSSLFSLFDCSSSSCASSGEYIGDIILPAQTLDRPPLLSQQAWSAIEKNNLAIDVGIVATHDDADLETIQLTPSGEYHKPEAEKYYIVKFNGNYTLYQSCIDLFANEAHRLNCAIVGFNYRGVAAHHNLKPHKFHDLVTDGIAQVQRLLDAGVKSEHITLDGTSLGGAVAIMVAYHFHQQKQPVYLWASNTFSSVSRAGVGLLLPDTDSNNNFNFKFESYAKTSLSVLKVVGWEEDIAKAYLAIDDHYKKYMNIAKKTEGEHKTQHTPSTGDGVIHHRASLYSSVNPVEKQKGKCTGVKVISTSPRGGHNDSRATLFSKKDPFKSGQQLFEEFILSHRLKK